MGQKVHPVGFRLGVIRDWDAKWYSDRHYKEYLLEDIKLREAIRRTHPEAGVSTIEIERQANNVSLTVHTARPGILIGRGGQRVDELRASLEKLTGKRVQLNIREVPQPELDAYLVARNVADQMERRISYRRVLKQSLQRSMQAGARGMKISCGGRLDGAEIARRITMHEGRVPLHTLRADIDYGFAEARTAMGRIGIKVWLYKGDILPATKEEELEEMALGTAVETDIEAEAETVAAAEAGKEVAATAEAVTEELVSEAEPVAEASPEAPVGVPAVAVETEQPAETPAPKKRVRKTPARAEAATADTEVVAVETEQPAETPAPKKRVRKTPARAEAATGDVEAAAESPTNVAEKSVPKRRTRAKAEPDTDETEVDAPKVTKAKAARAKTGKPRATKATKAVEATTETVSDDETVSAEAEADVEAAENQGDGDASA